MSVRIENDKLGRKHIVCDVRWPDGTRFRRKMDNRRAAERMDTEIRGAIYSNRWRQLKEDLSRKKAKLKETPPEDQPVTCAPLVKVADLIERYWEEYVLVENRSAGTKRTRLGLIRKSLGRIPLDEITRRHVSHFTRARRKTGVKPATINKDLTVLRHMFNWAVDEEYLEDLPWRKLTRLKEDEPDLRLPTEEIVDAVFDCLEAVYKPIFVFIRETGCRKGEALRLKYDHAIVQAEEPFVRFVQTKSGKNREVGLTQQALQAIRDYPRVPGCPWVFYNPRTLRPFWDLKRPWDQARRGAGYPWLRVHDLRTAYGIKLAESGVPMHFIQYVLGHSSVRITEERYARFGPEAPRRYVLKVLEGGRKAGVA